MTRRLLIVPAALACALAPVPACKKVEDRAAPATTDPAATAPSNATPPTTSEPNTDADHIVVLAHHDHPKPSDPVRLQFDRFRVVKAAFDPQTIEGGTATIEIDLSSLHSGSDERDDDLKSPSYLDVGKFATATVVIDHVNKKAGATYRADATVTAHGVTKTYPVSFDLLDRSANSIRIKGEHTFTRLDFGIGDDPTQDPDEQVGTDVTIEMLLTIAKS